MSVSQVTSSINHPLSLIKKVLKKQQTQTLKKSAWLEQASTDEREADC
jgi:hypothetical protein